MNTGRITFAPDSADHCPLCDKYVKLGMSPTIAAERNALVELVERIYRLCSNGAGAVSTIQKVHSAILDLYADMPSVMVVQAIGEETQADRR